MPLTRRASNLLSFPEQWPPDDDETLAAFQHMDYFVRITARRDARLEVAVTSEGREMASLMTQPLRPVGMGVCVCVASWDDAGGIELRLNGASVLPASDTSEKSREIPLRPLPEDFGHPKDTDELAFDEPRVAERCAKWVEWRKEAFEPGSITGKKNRVPLTKNFQRIQMEREVAHLTTVLYTAKAKPSIESAGQIAASLRKLVYWPIAQKGTYRASAGNSNPLLLRLAAMAQLPLPVYGMANMSEANLSCENGTLFHGLAVSLHPNDNLCELQDLQEWLSTPAVREFQEGNIARRITPIELIHWCASQQGGAHWDPTVDEQLVQMGGIHLIDDADLLTQFVALVACPVIGLCEYVVSALKNRLG